MAGSAENPIGLDGIEFLEFTTPEPEKLEQIFFKFGFKKIGQHKTKNVQIYRQGGINFIINNEPKSFAADFKKKHGPSICAWAVRTTLNAKDAMNTAIQRGARQYKNQEGDAGNFPSIYGIGDCVVYFVDKYGKETIYDEDFNYIGSKEVPGYGFSIIDHMTNNVPMNHMQKWCDYYEKIFNFKERRYFDIKGKKTGLISKVMVSPCGKFSIPINEPSDTKSQIQEYIEEYHGSGIQHVALLTDHIIPTMKDVIKNGVAFLDSPPHSYYQMTPERVQCKIKEDLSELEKLSILVDGDKKGYLLQIFTKNLCGPIFFEVIDRKGHDGFGDGNFQALFDAIERDQQQRGVL
jgi:4-hydroxyphenylpyruvate dioxygenase